ncbi:ShlB/FhaC/HecB family hemolysin secretion/activation protein [Glaesserella sp.]|uniref:ShlB/FhaC/HecB family hemolysin secretion/activation protein n=1 Tax=Glaesserella sp. TaxID=2094731 RepID=UPI0035A1B8E5
MKLRLVPILLPAFLLSSHPSHANQPGQLNPLGRLERLDAIEQQRQQQRQQQLEQQLQPQSDVRFDTAQTEVLSLSNHEMPCYPIHRIALVDYSPDNTLTSSQFQWAFDDAAQSLELTLPHCFGGEGVGILMKQIQNNLIEKGYLTTRVVTQEQDLRSGTLVLTVIPGKVRRLRIIDTGTVPRFSRLHAWTGLTLTTGDMVNVRDIEQSLENLKRVPTAEADIDILPSESPDAQVGESDVNITYRQAFPFRLNVNLDDAGSVSTGKLQASATLSVDNLFSANDLFYSSFTHSLKREGDESGKRAAKSLAFHYSVPFGYWTLSASHNHHRYHQEVFGAFDNRYIYEGESEHDKLMLSYLLYRDKAHKTTLSGAFWSRQSHNYIDNAEIEVQKRRMAGWEAGISHKAYIGKNTVELSAHYKRGTGIRGTLPAPEELYGEGASRPRILTAALSFTKPFMWGEQPWQYQSQWSAQWNRSALIAQDRFSIGGRYTVRGFDGELTLSGERGWLWRNELAWDINGKGHQFYFALDGGRVSGRSTENLSGHHLVGTAIGLRGEFGNVYYDLFVGRPVRKPEGFQTSAHVAGFNLGYRF